MDIVRLGERYTTNYLPDELIEGYSSMVWTERYNAFGDFEMKTPLIDETRLLLPEDTLISHLETGEVMLVETHTVNDNDEGVPELTVKGRAFELFLDHRYVEAPYKKKRKLRRNYSATAGLGVLLYNSIDNGSGKDVTRGDTDAETPEENDYPWNTLDKIANISITDSVPADGAAVAKRWWIIEGLLWPQFEVFLKKYDIGLRTIRPSSGSSAEILTVKANPLADRGEVVRTFTTGITSMRWDLYKGLDRTKAQTTNPQVDFSILNEDMRSPQHLWSSENYKTAMEVISSVGVKDVYRNSTQQAFTGIKRRVMQYDAGEPDIPTEPKKPREPRQNASQAQKNAYHDALDDWIDKHARWENRRDRIVEEFLEDLEDPSLAALNRQKRIVMLSGDISPLSPYKYKLDYDLGDLVTLTGRSGLDEVMRVDEYVRTDDSEGDRGYPGLVAP